jgi:hypothetical protein
MFLPMIYFALSRITDPARHRAENELFQLYHQPELRSLPEIAWVDRWVCAPDCAARSAQTAECRFDYAWMSWLRPPADAGARACAEHFERGAQLGLHSRAWAQTAQEAFMVPLKGYVRREALLSAEALPFRPNTGAYLVVSQFFRHHDAEAEDVFRWYDQTRIPDLLNCAGAAGAWTFAAREFYAPDRDLTQPMLRMTLVYLDNDPLAFAAEASELPSSRTRDTSHVEKILFAGPLRAIVPWQWDWFDASDARTAAQPARKV